MRAIKQPLIVAALCAAVSIAFPLTAWAGDDDGNWEVVSAPPQDQAPRPDAQMAAPPDTAPAPDGASASAGGRTVVACGEKAIAASAQVQQVVADINRVWDSDVKVYQSVQPLGPHAKEGGCIFYHPDVMNGLLNGWMNIKEAREQQPMVYAIFAHEVGHEVHNDFAPDRVKLKSQERELEADRFSGYTMSFLRIQPADIKEYFRTVGDDVIGGKEHGTSDQRATAFEYGWKLAEAGSSEQSIVPATGLGQP
jgi:hypothetical protein